MEHRFLKILIVLQLYAFVVCADTGYINVKDCGAYGDGTHNDYSALQNAIDSAAQTGTTVFFPAGVYAIDSTLEVPSGVSLLGVGRGIFSTNTPAKGTIIKNTGTAMSVRIAGHNISIESMVIYDTDNCGAAGGVEVLGDSAITESIVLSKILIFGFTDGVALTLRARNSGGVTYCSFYDVRIRHAGTGIFIDEDESSFVNSNSFYHGVISGGGFDYCLYVNGGNNNVFNATIMEPYSSEKGHLVIEKGEIIGHDLRIEGNQQADTIPLITCKAGTRNSWINGFYAGGLTVDYGDNYIGFRSVKSHSTIDEQNNLYENASFMGLDDQDMPFWEISGTGVSMASSEFALVDDYEVVKISVPAGIVGYFRPKLEFTPDVQELPTYEQVNFGAYVNTDVADFVTTTCNSPSGLVTGGYHPGDSLWHSVGMTSLVDAGNFYNPKFYFNNTTSDTAIFYITMPSLNFGYQVSQNAHYISASGGIITGTLTSGMTNVDTPTNGFLVVPKHGNFFEVNGSNTISRINHLTADRMPKGTVITLLFNNSGTSVTNSVYINLVSSFSAILNGSLTLISLGDGTWREVSRNN